MLLMGGEMRRGEDTGTGKGVVQKERVGKMG
jgi:hypothetical protein